MVQDALEVAFNITILLPLKLILVVETYAVLLALKKAEPSYMPNSTVFKSASIFARFFNLLLQVFKYGCISTVNFAEDGL